MDVPTDNPVLFDDQGPDPAEPAHARSSQSRSAPHVQKIPVAYIRPEDGLGRKRDRAGHRELRQSIEQFGVLTPITVRLAPDGSGDYLLIKGQGRTLACRMLGMEQIPAVVVDDNFAENQKVQQFLVENVARLRMRPIDRALLVARARQDGEETVDVAKRFGISAATVRRLESQMEGASKQEVAALKQGNVNLTLHAIIAKYVDLQERADVISVLAVHTLSAKDTEALFQALGWQNLVELGAEQRVQRLKLLAWAYTELSKIPSGLIRDRLAQLADNLPMNFGDSLDKKAAAR